MAGYLKVPSPPIGIRLFSKIFRAEVRGKRKTLNVFIVLILTFISYSALHACRKTLPVVKNKLEGNCSSLNSTCTDGFAPFNQPSRLIYFTILDMAWAFSYALSMPLLGRAAEKSSRKLFLILSLFGTGVVMVVFGLGEYFEIHRLSFYIILQITNGIFQSSGWPTVISITSAWLPKRAMGSILGIWGINYAVGNIIGQTLSSVFVDSHWGLAFISNGLLCLGTSLLVTLFLASKPEAMGFETPRENGQVAIMAKISSEEPPDPKSPGSFWDILFYPGVIEYSLSLFFCKIVIYTFLFWLPYYIKSVGIKNYEVTPSVAGYMASLFDVGGIFGNIVSGILLDIFQKGGCLCFLLEIMSCLSLFLFSKYGSQGFGLCVFLLLVTGFFVNSPNTLISGTISASLGNDLMRMGNKKASATVSAIIDGFGSLGAALAPIVVHRISLVGWDYVIYSLIASCAMSALFLLRRIIAEIWGQKDHCVQKKKDKT